MLTNDHIYALLEQKRVELGLSQAEVGDRAFDKPDSSALQNIRRGSSPSVERLGALADALGLELYFGPPRQPLSDDQKIGSDYARVPRFDVRLSAGPGAVNDQEQALSSLAFRTDWLARKGLVASKCAVLTVTGDSMEPSLYDGDLVMIDQRHQDVRNPGIFAFVDISGEARIKRLERFDQQLLLRSDNRTHPSEVRTGPDAARIRILGRVVWSGHEWG